MLFTLFWVLFILWLCPLFLLSVHIINFNLIFFLSEQIMLVHLILLVHLLYYFVKKKYDLVFILNLLYILLLVVLSFNYYLIIIIFNIVFLLFDYLGTHSCVSIAHLSVLPYLPLILWFPPREERKTKSNKQQKCSFCVVNILMEHGQTTVTRSPREAESSSICTLTRNHHLWSGESPLNMCYNF